MLDIQIALSGPNWHQPICVRFYGYYPGCNALSSHPSLFIINTEDFKVSVPADKLNEIMNLCKQWQSKSRCNKRDLQSLLYITKCVKASRPFLNHMLDFLRQADKQSQKLLTENFKRDLHWFTTFLPKFNG